MRCFSRWPPPSFTKGCDVPDRQPRPTGGPPRSTKPTLLAPGARHRRAGQYDPRDLGLDALLLLRRLPGPVHRHDDHLFQRRDRRGGRIFWFSLLPGGHDGDSMMTGIVFTFCILAAVGVFFYQLWRRFELLRSAVAVPRFDRIPERVRAVFVYAFGQRKFVRRNPGAERSAGWMHFFIFWGFCILGIQILTMFGRGYSDSFVIPGFSLNLLGGPYLLLRDFMEVAVLLAVGVALVRWGITHAPRLYGFLPPESRLRDKSHWEAYLILL